MKKGVELNPIVILILLIAIMIMIYIIVIMRGGDLVK